MCGLTGFIQPRGFKTDWARAAVSRMADAVAHRGPDNWGMWLDKEAGVALAHRRLSIVDLSAAGHQPMVSPNGRYVLSFNGEIYNHLQLRSRLDDLFAALGPASCGQDHQRGLKAREKWRGQSDTETLLASIEAWGLRETLKEAIGMFALALWDRNQRVLYLARDRVGEKPLYYTWQSGVFLFASEIKALKAHPSFLGTVDRNTLMLLVQYGYIPDPYSIYKDVFKLAPAMVLRVDCGALAKGTTCKDQFLASSAYWSLKDAVAGIALDQSEDDQVEALNTLLLDAVRQQMVADVPLGAFLSGGVDSSTIVALMQAQSRQPVKTFTIGFDEAGYDEAHHAKVVARHLKTDHTELYVSAKVAMEIIPRLPSLYDEPFADPSQIPTFLVSQLTKQHVTVALSGDGGDEVFGGYNRYVLAGRIRKIFAGLPRFIPLLLSHAMRAVSGPERKRLLEIVQSMFLPGPLIPQLGDKLQKLANIISCRDEQEIYHRLICHWRDPSEVVIGGKALPTIVSNKSDWPDFTEAQNLMLYLDSISYLPGNILVKVDRAAMAVSLETRVPFLDHRVVEFAWRLPLSMKIRNGQGKWILRRVLCKYVPEELINRPKMGFSMPIDTWLRGPLQGWAEALLDDHRLKREGFFDPASVQEKWREHLSGRGNWQVQLWTILMFQAWLEATR